jgi:hypothetical protein
VGAERWTGPDARSGDHGSARRPDGGTDASVPATPSGTSNAPPPARTTAPAPGRLTVRSGTLHGVTVLRLTALGGTDVRWTVSPGAPWLRASRTAGTLRSGGSVTVEVYADPARAPRGTWTARVTVEPSGTVVPVTGRGYPQSVGTGGTGGRRPYDGHTPSWQDRYGYGTHHGNRSYGAPRRGATATRRRARGGERRGTGPSARRAFRAR